VLQDKSNGVFEQNEGFFDMPTRAQDHPDKDFPLYHSWSYDRLYRYDMHKQPDVLLFLFFLQPAFQPKSRRAITTITRRAASMNRRFPRHPFHIGLRDRLHAQAYEFAQYARAWTWTTTTATRARACTPRPVRRLDEPRLRLRRHAQRRELLSFEPSIPRKWKSYSYAMITGNRR